MKQNYPIEDSDILTIRAYNCLKHAAINDLRQVSPMSDEQLLCIRMLTENELPCIKQALIAAGLEPGRDYGYVPQPTLPKPPRPAFLVAERQDRMCFAERYVEPICTALKVRGLYNKIDISEFGREKFAQIPEVTPEIVDEVSQVLALFDLPF